MKPRRPGKPPWLRRRLPSGGDQERVKRLIATEALRTVCQEAMCPNQFECFSRGTATFMILGETCTRNCGFCAVRTGTATSPDPDEPARVARAVADMGLRYAVVTSVTRDDLADGGAGHFAQTIAAIRETGTSLVEVLIPDFQGNTHALVKVLDARPDVLNHNIETVPRLYPEVRPQASYHRSLALLRQARQSAPAMIIKSGLMVGLGETAEELRETFADLAACGCDILTLGQYLQPSFGHLPVSRFVPPEEFDDLRTEALTAGLAAVAASPFVRSSYEAETLFREVVRHRQSPSFPGRHSDKD